MPQEEEMLLQDVYRKLDEAEADFAQGKTKPAKNALKQLRAKHDI